MAESSFTGTIHDKTLDVSFGSGMFADFRTGKVKERLELAVEAARQRNESIDHILLSRAAGWARPRWPLSSPRRWG